MNDFWAGFDSAMTKAAVPAWLSQGVNKVMGKFRSAGAAVADTAQHAKNVSTMQSQSLAAQGASPTFKAMRAASIGTLGAGGLLYAGNRLARADVHQPQMPQRPY
jgi:hypothetical protein